MSERFEIGGYWLDREPGSPNWYRYHYDTVQRSVSRRSLRTADFETAKLILGEWVTAKTKPTGQYPDAVYLAPVLESYVIGVTDKKPQPKRARRAGAIVLKFFGASAKISDLTPDRQRDFMRDCAEQGHSVGYISRNLGMVSAAINRAELALSPRILASESAVADTLDKPMPTPREWIPTIADIAKMLDAIPQTKRHEALFRFLMIELNTGARPEAALDLRPAQVSGRIVNLNPDGRKQNKKYRPTIIASRYLFGWLQIWDAQADRYIYSYRRDGKTVAVKSMKKQIKRLALEARVGLIHDDTDKVIGTRMNQYAIRHFVPTELRRRQVSKTETAEFLGHKQPEFRTTDRYTKFDPVYLAQAVRALDELMAEIDALTTRDLFAPGTSVVALKSLSSGG